MARQQFISQSQMMNDKKVFQRRLLFLIMILLSASVLAESVNDKQFNSTLSYTESDSSIHQNTEQTQAKLWQLTDEEWSRYQTLMEGLRGSISPKTLSPIEVLGIHARNDEERTRFAERWAMMMREDAERILAFQWAYDAAQKRLFPNSLFIDSTKLPLSGEKRNQLNSTDRVLFFTREGCAACDVLFDQLHNKLDRIAGIDVYLLAHSPEKQSVIRAWAKNRDINPEHVRKRTITLNIDGGILNRLPDSTDERPQIFRRRGDQLERLRSLGW